jgi:hypothetical protein
MMTSVIDPAAETPLGRMRWVDTSSIGRRSVGKGRPLVKRQRRSDSLCSRPAQPLHCRAMARATSAANPVNAIIASIVVAARKRAR